MLIVLRLQERSKRIFEVERQKNSEVLQSCGSVIKVNTEAEWGFVCYDKFWKNMYPFLTGTAIFIPWSGIC